MRCGFCDRDAAWLVVMGSIECGIVSEHYTCDRQVDALRNAAPFLGDGCVPAHQIDELGLYDLESRAVEQVPVAHAPLLPELLVPAMTPGLVDCPECGAPWETVTEAARCTARDRGKQETGGCRVCREGVPSPYPGSRVCLDCLAVRAGWRVKGAG